MLRVAVAFFFLFFVHNSLAIRLTDKLAKDAGEILAESKTDKTIRQCSCEEQHTCFDEAKHQLYDCMEECWSVTKQVTNDTDGLRKCIKSRVPILDNFLGCLETNLDSCAPSKTAGNITYIDYNKVIDNAEARIKKQTLKLVKTVSSSVQKLVQTALDLGTCVKQCFKKKNSNGFCFDKASCQPKIEVTTAVKALKKCAGVISWKKTAGEACQCAVDAGVSSLKQYCNLLGGSTSGRTSSKPTIAEISA